MISIIDPGNLKEAEETPREGGDSASGMLSVPCSIVTAMCHPRP
jgi:hypothetical protein